MIDIRKYSVVLLSAGIGRRLGKLGTSCPKCLLKINNITLIENIISNLQKRNIKEISIILGYKSKMIIDELRKFKKIKFNFIKITNYKKNGHGCSWHAFKDVWSIHKRPMILMHTDIFFDPRYLDNILNNKQQNIIGIHSNKRLYKNKSFLVKVNNDQKITNINFQNKIKNSVGEVIGINKISSSTAADIFSFMDKFLVKNNKRLSWEIVLDKYINTTNDSLFILKNQFFFWRNINFESDLLSIKEI